MIALLHPRCWLLALVALASACDGRASAEPRARAVPDAATDAAEAPAPAESIAHQLLPAPARGGGEPDMYHRFRIPLASTRIAFVDLHYSTPLIEALGQHTLVINGGYWAYAGQRRVIQGLLVVNGKRIAPFVPRAGGGVLSVRGERAELSAAEDWQSDESALLALQCKPRLVSRGAVVPKLESQRRAARTALCIRDGGRTLDAYLTDEHLRPTLPELAAFLLADGCTDALNLDGGPSTAAIFRRTGDTPLAVGVGFELPYGLGFSPR
jgi:Phosphodiester glycosidase